MYKVGTQIRFNHILDKVIDATIIKRDLVTNKYRITYTVNGEQLGRWINENQVIPIVKQFSIKRFISKLL